MSAQAVPLGLGQTANLRGSVVRMDNSMRMAAAVFLMFAVLAPNGVVPTNAQVLQM